MEGGIENPGRNDGHRTNHCGSAGRRNTARASQVGGNSQLEVTQRDANVAKHVLPSAYSWLIFYPLAFSLLPYHQGGWYETCTWSGLWVLEVV
jgi:hypothetical protein